jgi:hypothetical protein
MPPKNQNQSSQASQNKPLSSYEVVRNAGYSSERHMALSYGLKEWPIELMNWQSSTLFAMVSVTKWNSSAPRRLVCVADHLNRGNGCCGEEIGLSNAPTVKNRRTTISWMYFPVRRD